MIQTDEIQRLAELRDRGVLTTKEFERAKKQILNGGRPAPSRFMTAVAAVVAIMIIAGFVSKLMAPAQPEPALPAPAIPNPVEAAVAEPEAAEPEVVEEFAQRELACDLPEIKEKITQMVNQQGTELATRMGGGEFAHRLHILGIGTTTEIFRDPESGFVACLGVTRHPKGEGQAAYTVSWADRNIGQFWVELADAESLKEQYAAGQ